MIELPESKTLAGQISKAMTGKIIANVTANKSPHKFAWFSGDPALYGEKLAGKTVTGAGSFGGMVEIYAGDMRIILCDGANPRFCDSLDKIPAKHQLYIEFEDSTACVCTIQMYGGLMLLSEEEKQDYNETARSKPDPLSERFTYDYFKSLYTEEDGKISAKAFLATKQRIPGLGNGVLQDILFYAGLHPKRKMGTLSEDDYKKLYHSVTDTLMRMTAAGGRNTERDLFGVPGGYITVLSKSGCEKPCPVCGNMIVREAYLGGNVYYCPECQKPDTKI